MHGHTTRAGCWRADLIGAPPPGTEAPVGDLEEFRLWCEWLGHRLADAGPGAVEPHLARFAATAVALGVEPAAARILADRTAPDLVRARLFFKVATAFGELERDPT